MKLIVEMEMPKNCDECPLLDEIGDYPMCRATQETRGYNFDTRNKKMDKCPIKGELVRFKECKWYHARKENGNPQGYGFCIMDGMKTHNDDWFCADGERRDNE